MTAPARPRRLRWYELLLLALALIAWVTFPALGEYMRHR